MTGSRPSAAGRDPDWPRAEAFVTERLGDRLPDGARVIAWGTREERDGPEGPLYRRVAVSVLAPGADLVTFFGDDGGYRGWRDDGRLGQPTRQEAPTTLWAAVRTELGLPPALEPTSVAPARLDPVGWTAECRARLPGPGAPTIRAWADPATGRVIQLYAAGPLGSGAEPVEQRARVAALELLRGRLERAGLPSHPPHRYVVAAVKAVEPYPGGTQVRLATWRHWSDAFAEFAGPDAAPVSWRIDRLAEPVTQPPPAATIVRLAAQYAPPPSGATRPFASPLRRGRDPVRAWRVSWSHDHDGIPVVGDRYTVDFQPVTRTVVGVGTRWRTPAPNRLTPALGADAALAAAERARADRGFDDSLTAGAPSLCLVRPAEFADPGDRLAWRVPFADGAGQVDILVDAEDGRVALVAARR